MKSKDRGTNRKKQREAEKKAALRVKDAAFFAAVKYTLLGFGLLFVSFFAALYRTRVFARRVSPVHGADNSLLSALCRYLAFQQVHQKSARQQSIRQYTVQT